MIRAFGAPYGAVKPLKRHIEKIRIGAGLRSECLIVGACGDAALVCLAPRGFQFAHLHIEILVQNIHGAVTLDFGDALRLDAAAGT